jgi:hypothetical protein
MQNYIRLNLWTRGGWPEGYFATETKGSETEGGNILKII